MRWNFFVVGGVVDKGGAVLSFPGVLDVEEGVHQVRVDGEEVLVVGPFFAGPGQQCGEKVSVGDGAIDQEGV